MEIVKDVVERLGVQVQGEENTHSNRPDIYGNPLPTDDNVRNLMRTITNPTLFSRILQT